MKLYFLLLTCLLINLSSNDGAYSIETFINNLENNGYSEILNYLKCNFSTDIAIEFCKELIKSNDCETYVKVYLSCTSNGNRRSSINSESYIDLEELKNYLYGEDVQNVLLLNSTIEEVNMAISRVVTNIETC